MTDRPNAPIEELAAKFHEIYQAEAKRQGDVRHKDDYADLPENIKEFDRVLARYVLSRDRDVIAQATAEAYRAAAQTIDTTEGDKVDEMVREQILALTPADAQAAQAERDRQTRLDEARWWQENGVESVDHDAICTCVWCQRIAVLSNPPQGETRCV